jgi:hypothetical protein
MRTSHVLAAVLLLWAAVSAAAVDPTGDGFGETAGPDITGLSACQSADTLTIRLDFASPIIPPPSQLANAVYGSIDIDADRDPETGVSGRTDDSNPGGPLSGLGVDFLVELDNYDAETGTTTLRDIYNAKVTRVPVVFDTTSITVRVPLGLAQAPGGVNLAAIVGNFEDATDVVPNSGSVTAGPCCGNGVIDAGEDCDDGSECCDAVCRFADGAPCGGDVCGEPGTCAAGTCTGAGAPRTCDDGDPCFDDACDPVVGCTSTDRTGFPGALCAFDRPLPAACSSTKVSFGAVGGLVGKASGASGKKQKALLRKARKRLAKLGKQIGKLAKKGSVSAECAAGLQGQASDAIRRIEAVLAGG